MQHLDNLLTTPPDTLTGYESGLLGRITEYGWQTTSVSKAADGRPGFSYTTGFCHTVGRPEVLVFDFPHSLAHNVFGQMMRRARAGDVFPVGAPNDGILSGEPVFLFPIRPEMAAKYLRSSHWFYRRTDFPATQLVWRDRAGLFPWEQGCDPSLAALQPDLSSQGWRQEIV
jgi:hypothetical protein